MLERKSKDALVKMRWSARGNDFSLFPDKVYTTKKRNYTRSFEPQKAAAIARREVWRCNEWGTNWGYAMHTTLYSYMEKEKQRMADLIDYKGITRERVIDEISEIAFCKTGITQNGLDVRAETKLKALDMLAKWMGLYEKDNAQKAPQTQMLQIAFVGKDMVKHEKQKLLKQKEITSKTIWDSKLEEKEKETKAKMPLINEETKNS